MKNYISGGRDVAALVGPDSDGGRGGDRGVCRRCSCGGQGWMQYPSIIHLPLICETDPDCNNLCGGFLRRASTVGMAKTS